MERADRVRGCLLGLAAGDRNGGPLRMALRLGESVANEGGVVEEAVLSAYFNWWRGPPHDKHNEKAFDTGQTFSSVMSAIQGGATRAAAAQTARHSAGVNGAHRIAPVACCASIADEALELSVACECALTHVHPEAIACAQFVARLLRILITNGSTSVREAAREALAHVPSASERVHAAVNDPGSLASAGGYAPETVAAALMFAYDSESFQEGLLASLGFAGPANYCPVLVGAILGAHFGAKASALPMVHAQLDNTVVECYERLCVNLCDSE